MEINIDNFGTIDSARVKIGGLTVIAGENDSGKSTVGKILFSLVKAFVRLEENFIEERNERLLHTIRNLYFQIRKFVDLSENDEIRISFQPPKFFDEITVYGEQAIYDRTQLVKDAFKKYNLEDMILPRVLDYLEEIKEIAGEENDPKKVRYDAVRKAFYSEFRGEIVNKNKSLPASVEIRDGKTRLLYIEWHKSGLNKFEYYDELQFNDATYVDNPAVLQFHQFIQNARTQFDAKLNHSLNMVPLHVKDLAKKLQESIYTFDLFSNKLTNVSNRALYFGNFYFDRDTNQFLLDRGNYQIHSSNVASGIKNLGMFDILSSAGYVSKNTLTILDEPEINLHPEWQVHYCKSICQMVSEGADIIVTTHSPYIVEALNFYAKKCNIEPDIYLTEKNDHLSSFKDVSKNIALVMEKLSAPLYELNGISDDDF